MKKFWNYIFYFTWKLHCVIGINTIERPLKRILNLVPFFANNLKKGEENYRNTLDNPKYGFNIGFAFYDMLTTSIIMSSCFLALITILFNINIDNSHKLWMFASIAFLLSYIPNEIILGWHKKTYLKYFKEFDKEENKTQGYIITLCFHLSVISLGIFMVYITQ